MLKKAKAPQKGKAGFLQGSLLFLLNLAGLKNYNLQLLSENRSSSQASNHPLSLGVCSRKNPSLTEEHLFFEVFQGSFEKKARGAARLPVFFSALRGYLYCRSSGPSNPSGADGIPKV